MNDIDSNRGQRVAIIGAGISGLTCAYLLHKYGQGKFDITLFEKADRLGGHTATVDFDWKGKQKAIDTGFIVFNDWTYPNFIHLLNELEVASQPTDMSFSVSCKDSGLEYCGRKLSTLFAQPKNMASLKFWSMIFSILKFNQNTIKDFDAGLISSDLTLGDYLDENHYRGLFVSHYLAPMCAAIWSSSIETVLKLPLLFFIQFFKNHGLLSVSNRPQWRVVRGGSKQYISPLIDSFKERIRLSSAVVSISRKENCVDLLLKNGTSDKFDSVVIASHSDEAFEILEDPSVDEKTSLSNIPYEENQIVLHTDTRCLPSVRRAWAAWNYQLSSETSKKALLTYNMNILQNISGDDTFCVSLNPSCSSSSTIDPRKIIAEFSYSHPQFSRQSIEAQNSWEALAGKNRTWYCGAYWGNGFHEDGVSSAIRVAQGFGVSW